MFINSFAYQNKQTGWTLQKVSLDRFNLLVGASGVGKTQILRAFREVQQLAYHGQATLPLQIDIEFRHGETTYRWEFESSSGASSTSGLIKLRRDHAYVTREKLTRGTNDIVVDRDQQKFLLQGTSLPQLNPTESALKLIAAKPINTIRRQLGASILHAPPHEPSTPVTDQGELENLLTEFKTLSSSRHELTALPPQLKALFLQEESPAEFHQIKETFRDIFPSVEDIQVELTSSIASPATQSQEQRIQFKLKERDIDSWVSAENISSGMLRTLIHLVDLSLAPKDSVVLIDEFENSLGVNCMGPLTDFILSRAPELQFIITSHHPYIINKIPKEHWKVVRRHGSTVQVTPASEVRALQGASAQDDFTRLINAPEFEEGLS
jgi:AAA15 family ATPase/GTPase